MVAQFYSRKNMPVFKIIHLLIVSLCIIQKSIASSITESEWEKMETFENYNPWFSKSNSKNTISSTNISAREENSVKILRINDTDFSFDSKTDDGMIVFKVTKNIDPLRQRLSVDMTTFTITEGRDEKHSQSSGYHYVEYIIQNSCTQAIKDNWPNDLQSSDTVSMIWKKLKNNVEFTAQCKYFENIPSNYLKEELTVFIEKMIKNQRSSDAETKFKNVPHEVDNLKTLQNEVQNLQHEVQTLKATKHQVPTPKAPTHEVPNLKSSQQENELKESLLNEQEKSAELQKKVENILQQQKVQNEVFEKHKKIAIIVTICLSIVLLGLLCFACYTCYDSTNITTENTEEMDTDPAMCEKRSSDHVNNKVAEREDPTKTETYTITINRNSSSSSHFLGSDGTNEYSYEIVHSTESTSESTID